jgi:hypothetical protein
MMSLARAVLNQCDGDREEATEVLKTMVDEFLANPDSDPEEILFQEGLEPDYVMEFLMLCEQAENIRARAKGGEQ